jgi:Tfp pilus assembly protein PilO
MHVIDDDTRRFGRLLHYAGVLATVFCATAGYTLLHVPAVHEIAKTLARIDELLQSAENGSIMREQHRAVSEKLHEVTTRIAHVQGRVPQGPDSVQFLNEVNRIADSVKLAIKNYDPGNPQTKNGNAEVQVTLKGQGSFGSICSFLDGLAKLTRLSKIKDLTLSASDESDKYPMTATLVIYFGLRGQEAASAQEGRSG